MSFDVVLPARTLWFESPLLPSGGVALLVGVSSLVISEILLDARLGIIVPPVVVSSRSIPWPSLFVVE